jgi:hypothetical protein
VAAPSTPGHGRHHGLVRLRSRRVRGQPVACRRLLPPLPHQARPAEIGADDRPSLRSRGHGHRHGLNCRSARCLQEPQPQGRLRGLRRTLGSSGGGGSTPAVASSRAAAAVAGAAAAAAAEASTGGSQLQRWQQGQLRHCRQQQQQQQQQPRSGGGGDGGDSGSRGSRSGCRGGGGGAAVGRRRQQQQPQQEQRSLQGASIHVLAFRVLTWPRFEKGAEVYNRAGGAGTVA